MKEIALKGARLHNLKNIDVSIPKNKLTVATGVSGSGKSSLVFDIIFEEGRRQYLRSLGILTGFEDENKFDSITGISPTIAVQQSIIRQSNPRSTVGTRTGILNMLAVLYAIEGQPTCTTCQTPVDSNLTCPKCGNKEEHLPASYFSYNAPNGMCPKCSGRGSYFEINMEKLVPDNQMTLKDLFDRVKPTPGYANLLQKRFSEYLKVPFSELPDEVKADVIYGHFVESNYDKRSYCLTRILQGGLYLNPEMQEVYAMTVCSVCHGFRVGEEAQRVHLNGKHIGELGKMTITELQSFLTQLQAKNKFTAFGQNLLKDTLDKVNNLVKARLGHLSLYREMPTLSGGEIQRLFLNSHLDSKMDSLIYILDEPTVGLHESEKAELLESIKALKELGNTVIVVEHDENTIAMAEHVIDIGPKAGVEGGQVIYQGDYTGLLECKTSITGLYLSGKATMPQRTTRLNQPTAVLTIKHAKTNNLKDVTVSFPLGGLVGIAGVSGSGKSSLVSDTLVPLLKNHFHDDPLKDETPTENEPSETDLIETVAEKLEGLEHLSGYAEVSQAPIGRNVTSNPASYIGIWDKIRKLFANQPEALKQGLAAGHFSFNSKGACPVCGGSGKEKIWLGGETFIHKVCSGCQGKRYNDEALSVKYKNKNISEVLEMSVSEAAAFFEEQSAINSTLKILERIGMGYIEVGQPTPTLSGGESQRIKLAKEIGRRRKGNILYVLDEPTTGLSLYDTAKLIQLLDELVAKGNSVLVIEHDPAVLSVCDWIVELGPKGGADGGRIIAEGRPLELKNNSNSITGAYLHPK